MKRKFLITNDVGLALDKVNVSISMLRSENGCETNTLLEVDDLLIESLQHLQQALDNLEDEGDL